MTHLSYAPADAVEFAENPEPRCPCVLVLDTSASMRGKPIEELNAGLEAFRQAVNDDPLARRRVEVAVVTFGGDVAVPQEFVTAADFQPPRLAASGLTPLGTAVLRALDLLKARRAQYEAGGVACYKPWLFLITDGTPEGEPAEQFEQAAREVKAAEAARRLAFFAVAVDGADEARLAALSSRSPQRLQGLQFRELFVWLSRSVQAVSRSRPGDAVPLPSRDDWASV